jgi:hypothetical protein
MIISWFYSSWEVSQGYQILAPPKDRKKVHSMHIYTITYSRPYYESLAVFRVKTCNNHPNRIHCNPWKNLVRYIITSNILLSMWLIAMWTHFFCYKLTYIRIMISGCFFPNGSLGHGRRGPRRKNTSMRVSIHIL